VPEILEVEAARALIDERALHRPIATVHAPDTWFLKRGLTPRAVRAALRGTQLTEARRRGKLIVLDVDNGVRLALHLGMSGRVIIDGEAAGDPLIYASNRDVDAWRRFGLTFVDGGSLYLRDPRRLGAVELDPDEDRLGPTRSTLTLAQLRRSSPEPRADQGRHHGPVAHRGPRQPPVRRGAVARRHRPGRAPPTPRRRRDADLHRAIRDTLRVLGRRGGSHTGDLTSQREPGAHCPRDGAPLLRRTIGGRTTYSCPLHQL
jgi:formamidopyrimidine-DNA glycosylase